MRSPGHVRVRVHASVDIVTPETHGINCRAWMQWTRKPGDDGCTRRKVLWTVMEGAVCVVSVLQPMR